MRTLRTEAEKVPCDRGVPFEGALVRGAPNRKPVNIPAPDMWILHGNVTERGDLLGVRTNLSPLNRFVRQPRVPWAERRTFAASGCAPMTLENPREE
ncbi:hypothetical protein N7530_012864 [Penicillium desertorum]|uniref:Uncharacterized protein n=1 Tax=Penicillium desertorum TaxID=1303715 RepID=A0A9X0BFM9_9EURO|nr:hypothetical protein N7530_012864 [Penicillium desertorum]